jgi:DNA ligase-associated metallophosphoesterase
MSSRISCEWAGEKLELLGEKALFWPREETLIIADPHFGKPSAFRNAGIPVPTGTTVSDLNRLDSILDGTAARRLVVLGDFFHHHTGQCDHTMGILSDWRESRAALDILIVMGNHDRSSLPPPAAWHVDYQCHPVVDAPFMFCHEPCRKEGTFVLSGHIHPSITLHDPVGPAMRLPCFLFSEDYALLPAFGGFTGTAKVKPIPGDQVFAVADGSVFEIPLWTRKVGVE